MVLMALSGPVANISAAFVTGLFIRYFLLSWDVYQIVFINLLFMNLGLGIFNLLPIPPLDGSHVLKNVLPPKAARRYREFGRYGPLLLLGIIMLDNFTPDQTRQSIKLLEKNGYMERIMLESSGGINAENLLEYASTGVDVLSIGEITHSVRSMDLSLEITKVS